MDTARTLRRPLGAGLIAILLGLAGCAEPEEAPGAVPVPVTEGGEVGDGADGPVARPPSPITTH